MTAARTLAPSTGEGLTDRQQARRERVIDAALSLSRRRPFDQIQVKDVAQEAGVALGTLYHYFSSKDHLFAEALVRWATALESDVDRRPLRGGTAPQRLTEVLHRSVRAFQQQPNLAKLVTTLEVSSDPFAVEIISRLDQSISAVYASALAGTGLDEGTVQAMVRVVDMTLAGLLRLWTAGRLPILDVYDRLDQTVALLFRT